MGIIYSQPSYLSYILIRDYVVEAEGSKFYLNICKEVQTKDSKGPQNPGKSGFQHDKDGSFIPIGSSDSITIKASRISFFFCVID